MNEIIKRIKTDEVDVDELLEYVSDNDINIAIAAAESKKATVSILNIASRDSDRRVRYAAVNNPNTGKETLIFLSADTDAEISEIANKRLKGVKE